MPYLVRFLSCYSLTLAKLQLKSKFFHSFWPHFGLELFIWEAGGLALSWLLFNWWDWLNRFGDVLFLVGVLELMAASFGMMSRPYGVGTWYGVPALPVQPSEQERRAQAAAEFIQKRSFALRLCISGLLTILAALIVYYVI